MQINLFDYFSMVIMPRLLVQLTKNRAISAWSRNSKNYIFLYFLWEKDIGPKGFLEEYY